MGCLVRVVLVSLCLVALGTRLGMAQVALDGQPVSVEALVAQGSESLRAMDYPAAREAFARAVLADARNAVAQHGLGISHLHLGEFAQAVAPLERALALAPDDTTILNNLAAALVGSNNPMRAARHIVDFLTARPRVLEEHLSDALATALDKADPQARRGRLFTDLSAFHQSYQVRLEARRPGMKRWGYQWITAEEFRQKQAQAKKQQDQLAAVNRQISVVERRLADLRQEQARLQSRVDRGWDHPWVLHAHRDRIEAARIELEGLQQQHDALNAADAPPVHNHIAILPLPPVRGGPANPALPPELPEPAPDKSQPAPPVDPHTLPFREDAPAPVAVPPPPPVAPPVDPFDPPNPFDAPKPLAHQSTGAVAFPVAPDLVVTAWVPLRDGKPFSMISIDGTNMQGRIVRHDETLGLALIRLEGRRMNALALAGAFEGGQVMAAAIPRRAVLGLTVVVIDGEAQPPVGRTWKVNFDQHPRQAGAPIIAQGRVVGVTMPADNETADAITCIPLEQLRRFLGDDARGNPHVIASDVLLQLHVQRN